jgi:hypothetical protein
MPMIFCMSPTKIAHFDARTNAQNSSWHFSIVLQAIQRGDTAVVRWLTG